MSKQKKSKTSDSDPAPFPKIDSLVVMYNGNLSEVELEDPRMFASYDKALGYAETEARAYPGLSLVILKVETVVQCEHKMTYIQS